MILIETHPPEKNNHFAARLFRWTRGLMAQPKGNRWHLLTDRLRWYMQYRANPSRFEPAMPSELEGVKERHMHAFFSHQPKPFDGPVDLATVLEKGPLESAVKTAGT